jgi:hypothetical protein
VCVFFVCVCVFFFRLEVELELKWDLVRGVGVYMDMWTRVVVIMDDYGICGGVINP